MALYQPKINDPLIRKLHVVAKRNGIPMTYVINAILEHHLVNEAEPPLYEKTKQRTYERIDSKREQGSEEEANANDNDV